MKDYSITLHVGVQAHDQEEAIDIAYELEKVLKNHSPYTLDVIEADEIEEL